MADERQPQDQSYQEQVLRYEYVLKALSDIGEELCRVTSFETQLKSLLHLLLGTLGVSKGGIFLYDSMSGELSLRCSWKLSARKASVVLTREEVDALEKLADPITFSAADFPYLKHLIAQFAADDLNSISILKVREKLIGLLVVGQKLKRSPFSEKETSFLTTLSRNISVAINNFLLLSELRETNKRLDEKIQEVSILYQATQMIASELQLKTLLDMAMNATSEISEVTRGSIWLYDEDTERFTLCSHLGDSANLPEHLPLADSPLCHHLLQHKVPLIRTANGLNDLHLNELDSRIFGNTFIIVPIIHQGEFLGLMHLSEKISQGDFTERDQRLIKVFAVQLGAAVKNAKLYEQAITDGMTHLYLHRYFKQRLADEFKRAVRFKRNLALIMIDIDHFKKLNDTYGHQTGDEVLKRVASIMRKAVRTHDLPVRYGGEEFALVLPETDMAGALAVAERVRKSIEHEVIEHNGKTIRITASFGVSVHPDSATEAEALIKAADEALYRSKENGRNRVTAAQAIHPPLDPTTSSS
ncbi:MAG: diguanylate cyclase/phosphodiesterase (GGDEF & EAL domains) with PAS/PAC sensor(s) [Candidatus Ozemobacter sibiricus]|jgi:diguanylate cyclase (GGDEF)-like protein|uniref:Diguanylate cyclase/phosphodiesterase (GGDEF & EAL domains) with PAS/PAC sensor(S) n=1 Tax=Candidatus Ozemobacter sibiricus TaxID=2268124 RepID=A0A367ZVN6_9BACT|nr:MAG: diguanylate cyclase/phosphodiesterase (GGDEF & EAL domains) with PAS/PAC sensor(s) [Candidatus Ozemobacter sibiricus]